MGLTNGQVQNSRHIHGACSFAESLGAAAAAGSRLLEQECFTSSLSRTSLTMQSLCKILFCKMHYSIRDLYATIDP